MNWYPLKCALGKSACSCVISKGCCVTLWKRFNLRAASPGLGAWYCQKRVPCCLHTLSELSKPLKTLQLHLIILSFKATPSLWPSLVFKMALARHIDPDSLLEKLRNSDSKVHHHHARHKNVGSTLTPYSSRYNAQDEISKFRIPQNGAPVSWIEDYHGTV